MKPIVNHPAKSAGKAVKARPIEARLETVPARTTWMPGDDESRKQWVIYAGEHPEVAYEQMREQVARAICPYWFGDDFKDVSPNNQDACREPANAILENLGLVAHRGGGKKGGKL